MQASDSRFLQILKKTGGSSAGGERAYGEFSEGPNKIKTFFKKWPRFYQFVRVLIAPGSGITGGLGISAILKSAFGNSLPEGKIILNLGSGTRRLHEDIINVDIYPFSNVDLVADITDLPLHDESCDMVICDSVLEHVAEAEKAAREIARVVKKGGYVYVTVPFLYTFHVSPDDYYRWTRSGLKKSFRDFETLEAGVVAGPVAVLHGVLSHMSALLFSFGSEKAYHFLIYPFMAVFAPLKLFDFVFRLFPGAHEAASIIYFFGRKHA